MARGDAQNIVQQYLAYGSQHSAATKFEVNATETAQITLIELVDHQGNPSTEFDISLPIQVRVVYQIKETLPDHRVGVVVTRHDGQDVFLSFSTDLDGSSGKTLPGTYMATLHIPDHLLAPGNYLISVSLQQYKVAIYDSHEHVVSFGISGSPYKLEERRRGLLVYPFKWDVKEFDSRDSNFSNSCR